MGRAGRPAVFLDRDGTLIDDVGYPRDPDQVRLLPGVGTALIQLQSLGFLLVIVSNQSGVGRGMITPEEARAVHEQVISELAANGVQLDGAYYCPHSPDNNSPCRKPEPGMLRQAAEDLGINLSRSFMIGDKLSDVEAGKQAGCWTILFGHSLSSPAKVAPDYVATDWDAVVAYISAPARELAAGERR